MLQRFFFLVQLVIQAGHFRTLKPLPVQMDQLELHSHPLWHKISSCLWFVSWLLIALDDSVLQSSGSNDFVRAWLQLGCFCHHWTQESISLITKLFPNTGKKHGILCGKNAISNQLQASHSTLINCSCSATNSHVLPLHLLIEMQNPNPSYLINSSKNSNILPCKQYETSNQRNQT